ncbi:hypothetical protein [Jannaschia ovalis]|uniref:MFS transporter n=1 Tax=Jannaschia ovalis TaxID=3038773 RepID=A0ABY8LFB5_9RHOB|nr:hypothetical protein [Jannaschia sp. GRR-S6-38]WGH79098.1 hypothetical protein P8627_02210 [Jannaschia sp. GRR-S6-38]
MTGRRAIDGLAMALHWAALPSLVAALARPGPATGLLMVALATAWIALTAVRGLRRPGPKLAPRLRALVRPAHGLMLATFAAAAVWTLIDPPAARPLLLALLGAAALHGVFNLWRASVLGDGAFRAMLPRAITGA